MFWQYLCLDEFFLAFNWAQTSPTASRTLNKSELTWAEARLNNADIFIASRILKNLVENETHEKWFHNQREWRNRCCIVWTQLKFLIVYPLKAKQLIRSWPWPTLFVIKRSLQGPKLANGWNVIIILSQSTRVG